MRHEPTSGAERAFEHLRAEVTIMRHAVEELRIAVAEVPTTDYTETLAAIAEAQEHIRRATGSIAKFTGASAQPEVLAREMARVREQAIAPWQNEMRMARESLQGIARMLTTAVGQVRGHEEQHRRLVQVGVAGLVAGLFAFPLLMLPLARILPDALGAPQFFAELALGTSSACGNPVEPETPAS